MKYAILTLALLVFGSNLFAQGVGVVEFKKGTVSVARNGKVNKKVGIGDAIQFGDSIATGAKSELTLKLDKASGFSGTIVVKEKTTFTLKQEALKGASSTQVELAAGSVGLKLAKLSGSSNASVRTESAVMGVRGTTFDVVYGPQGNVLVACTEGKVACDLYEGEKVVASEFATPGQAVELTVEIEGYSDGAFSEDPPKKLKRVSFDVAQGEKFKDKWHGEAIEAFRANASGAIKFYAKRYFKSLAAFNETVTALSSSPVIRKWKDEDVKGLKPVMATAMTERKEVDKHFMTLKRIMFFFEIDYHRLMQLKDLVAGRAEENLMMENGQRMGAFIKGLESDSDALAEKMAFVRYAFKLYEARSLMTAGVAGDDDFFGDSDF